MMNSRSFLLADQNRARQFSRIGSLRGFGTGFDTIATSDGVRWAINRIENDCVAMTWLGKGWVYDSFAREQWAERLETAHLAMGQADDAEHHRQLSAVVHRIRFGKLSERLLWAIHFAVMRNKTSVICPADVELGTALWGGDRGHWPHHWRRELNVLLQGLGWLHVTTCRKDGQVDLGPNSALINHSALLRRSSEHCGNECPWQNVRGHRHFLVNIGVGFLGELERFAELDEINAGVRKYKFLKGPNRKQKRGPTLRRSGKNDRLMQVYLPAKLGSPKRCAVLTNQQHRLLQTIVRETTRKKSGTHSTPAEVELIVGNRVPDAGPRMMIECPHLDLQGRHVTFGGNKRRKGCGYLLTSASGWLAKAGYCLTDVTAFLTDLAGLANVLELTIVGLLPGVTGANSWFDLDQLCHMAADNPRGRALAKLHVRIYTNSDYVERWNAFFSVPDDASQTSNLQYELSKLVGVLKRSGVSKKELAAGIRRNYSLVCKVLKGKRRCRQEFLDDSIAWIESKGSHQDPGHQDGDDQDVRQHQEGNTDGEQEFEVTHNVPNGTVSKLPMVSLALDYRRRGWSTVPQLPGAKSPPVKWKPFQVRCPTKDELRIWYEQWPQAGIAVVLGPVSDIFVVDVDGPEAHQELLSRLGAEPAAPKVISGSGKPHRYHLFFTCPDFPTKAKKTPWHPKLEFRGQGGIIIAPPSLHKSGNRYVWAEGRSLSDLALPELPPEICAALQAVAKRPQVTQPIELNGSITDTSLSTMEYLLGTNSNGPQWNSRLFQAACDLAGRGVDRDVAEAALLAGARPWDGSEEQAARQTIESAYSEPREPNRV